jgi:hypothetical protein
MPSHLSTLVPVLLALCVAAGAVPSNQNNEIKLPGYGAKIVFQETEAAISILPVLHNESRFYSLKFSHIVESNESESTPFQQAAFDQAVLYAFCRLICCLMRLVGFAKFLAPLFWADVYGSVSSISCLYHFQMLLTCFLRSQISPVFPS